MAVRSIVEWRHHVDIKSGDTVAMIYYYAIYQYDVIAIQVKAMYALSGRERNGR